MQNFTKIERVKHINTDLIEQLIENTFREKIGVTPFAILFEIFEVQSSVLADLLLFGEFKQGVVLLTSEFIGNSVLFNVLFHLLHLPVLWCF